MKFNLAHATLLKPLILGCLRVQSPFVVYARILRVFVALDLHLYLEGSWSLQRFSTVKNRCMSIDSPHNYHYSVRPPVATEF